MIVCHPPDEVSGEGRGEGRVGAEPVDLHLHFHPKPPLEVDVIPGLFSVSSRAIIMDVNLMIEVVITQDLGESGALAVNLRLTVLRVVEDLSVAVP